MKKLLLLCACAIGALASPAQTPIDHFNVGPYVIDYNGKGDVKYRLRDGIDLYEFFELQRDTTVVVNCPELELIDHGFEIGAKIGFGTHGLAWDVTGRYAISVAKNVYFTPGVQVGMTMRTSDPTDYAALEVGIPLTIGFSEMARHKVSIYAEIGIVPTFYTLTSKPDDYQYKKSGVLISPMGECGLNIPSGDNIFRIGVWGEAKLNTATDNDNVYKKQLGVGFAGLKVGYIF